MKYTSIIETVGDVLFIAIITYAQLVFIQNAKIQILVFFCKFFIKIYNIFVNTRIYTKILQK